MFELLNSELGCIVIVREGSQQLWFVAGFSLWLLCGCSERDTKQTGFNSLPFIHTLGGLAGLQTCTE